MATEKMETSTSEEGGKEENGEQQQQQQQHQLPKRVQVLLEHFVCLISCPLAIPGHREGWSKAWSTTS